MQDSPIKFFDKLTEYLTNGINNCMLGKIEKFDAKTMKAEVSPMVKYKNKDGNVENRPLLIEVPVSFIKAGPFVIRPPYKKGDIVLVVFADEDIDNVLLSGSVSEPNSTRKHSLDDAIVVGGIMPFTTTLPNEHSEDLIIAKDDFTTKIVVKEDGEIIIQGGKVYLGSEDAEEGVPLGDKLKQWLDNHTHPYTWTSSGGAGTTSPPSEPSPDPSEVVKTI